MVELSGPYQPFFVKGQMQYLARLSNSLMLALFFLCNQELLLKVVRL